MKLSSVEISEFQSIRYSNPFDIGDITCLVGKNEAGKTAILQALSRLNPLIPDHEKFDVTDDDPRAEVEDYQQEVEANRQLPAIVVKGTFTLTEEELANIAEEFGNGILTEPKLTLKKGYDNELYVELPTDEKVAVKAIVDAAQLSSDLTKELHTSSNIEDLNTLVDSKAASKSDPEADPESKVVDYQPLKLQIDKIQKAGGLTPYVYGKYLSKELPKFLYFDEYSLMTGQENIQGLMERKNQKELKKTDYPLLGLIELARLDLGQLLNPDRTEWLVNRLEGAS